MLLRLLHLLVVVLTASVVRAQEEAARFERAYERIDAFVSRSMEEEGTPGLALALTSRDALLRVATYGFADIKARVPVTRDTLFEIGSISKSFTAVALMQLMEEGRFDPHAPVTRFLPWFKVRSEYPPITSHHLLTHTSGLPRDRDDVPSSLYQAAAVTERRTGSAPGTIFAYSNVGFQILGYLLEEIEGRPYPEAIRSRVLDRVGMTCSEASITHATRARLATGYERLYDDRPSRRRHPLVEATWLEYGAGDGSVAAPPADLAAYLRMFLNRGRAEAGRVISEASFERMIGRPEIAVSDPEAKGHYGYGLSVQERDGRTLVRHSGGMVGYRSMMLGDLDEGLGAVVFMNGPGAGREVAEFVLSALRAAKRGDELPNLPPLEDRTLITNATDYAGTYTAPDGRKLNLDVNDEKLILVHEGERVVLERARTKDHFLVDHANFELFPLRFGRSDGTVVEVVHGGDWYAGPEFDGPLSFDVPEEWLAYPGHYRTPHSWFNNFRVVLRKGQLWFVSPDGREDQMVLIEPGFFRVGDEHAAERLHLDTVIRGKAQRAIFSGVPYYRSFTP